MKSLFKAALATLMLCFVLATETKAQDKYEYATVSVSVSGGTGYKRARISMQGEFELRPFVDMKDAFDLNPTMKILQELEDKGWEVFSYSASSFGNLPEHHYLLRKKRQ